MGCTNSCLSLAPSVGPLLKAVHDGRPEDVSTRLRGNPALLSMLSAYSVLSAHADTPLHIAVEDGRMDVVEAICSFLAAAKLEDVAEAVRPYCHRHNLPLPGAQAEGLRIAANMINSKGQTPLMYACFSGRADIAEYLLQRGADPWIGDRCGNRTALHYAAMAGHAACIRALMIHVGANHLNRPNTRYINARSLCGLVPLHYAVCSNNLEAVRELLEHDPNINAPSVCLSYDIWVTASTYSCPLHFAACKGHTQVCKEILQHYALRMHTGTLADPRTRIDADGKMPWHLARGPSNSSTELADMLHPAHDLRALFGPSQLEELRCGVPRLYAIAAAALHAKLLRSIEAAEATSADNSSSEAQVEGPSCAPSCGGGLDASASTSASTCGARQPCAAAAAAAAATAHGSGCAAGAAGAAVPKATDDDDDGLCYVCFANDKALAPAKCGHGLCGTCAKELCRGMGCKPLLCPLCRAPVGAFARSKA